MLDNGPRLAIDPEFMFGIFNDRRVSGLTPVCVGLEPTSRMVGCVCVGMDHVIPVAIQWLGWMVHIPSGFAIPAAQTGCGRKVCRGCPIQ